MPLRLAEWRKQKGWTQARLAKETGMSASAIAMYETGRRTPDTGALARLAAALGVSMADLQASPVESKSESDPEYPPQGVTSVPRDTGATPTEVPEMAAPFETRPAGNKNPVSSVAASSSPSPAASQRWSPATAIPLSADEARIVLFLRLHPEALSFLTEYVQSPPERREQLQKTWDMIRQFPI
ncbi:MAG: helix-turn-helix domain-containing protein [Alicyclobacillus herbarius]|uniref:helix-turn-helix domain-containing protein n=1 Tax=Alicyclobacillus herbarius TaxID=122960 RepID=UPI0023574698|nr:transcriptional regulator [Alicyclobacillus herbarius]MCL6631142.1 helix-turn-helix domain-containing protein [Alicyclobacillus herbarius]